MNVFASDAATVASRGVSGEGLFSGTSYWLGIALAVVVGVLMLLRVSVRSTRRWVR